MRNLRIFWRILKETYESIKFSGITNLMVISIMSVTLALFGGVLQFNSAIKQISQNIDSQLEFSVYIQDSVSPTEIAETISSFTGVKKVDIIPKDVAWQDFREKFNFSSEAGNPLPNTLHVNVFKYEGIKEIIEKIKNLSGIEQISYAPDFFSGLIQIRNILFSFGVFISIILAISAATIISNTIQLMIKSRSLEIRILRLVGVEDWYIRGPFICHGVFYGIVSSICAILPLVFCQNFIWNTFQKAFSTVMPLTFAFDAGSELGSIFFTLLLTGIVVCGISSYIVTSKYIKI